MKQLKEKSKKTILFAISSLGLGHATRTLPVIKSYIDDSNIIIVSHANSLKFLKKELSDYKNIKFYDFIEYPALERGSNFVSFCFHLVCDAAITVYRIIKENKFIEKLIQKEKVDFIFSDGKYGAYSKKIPSFLLSHQITMKLPTVIGFVKPFFNLFQLIVFKNFNLIFIPDYEDSNHNLSGFLSHNYLLNKINHKFVGILSSYENKKIKKDIDYLFVVAGYLKKQNNIFIKKLIEQSKHLDGSKVFMLGNCESKFSNDTKNNVKFYYLPSKELKQDLFLRAKFVISRSGYTTIMDLVECNKPALLFPTPNQSEQVELAKMYDKKGYFLICLNQKRFNLLTLLKNKDKISSFKPKTKTNQAIKIIQDTIKKEILKYKKNKKF